MNFKLLAVFIAFIVAASIISLAEAEAEAQHPRLSILRLNLNLLKWQ